MLIFFLCYLNNSVGNIINNQNLQNYSLITKKINFTKKCNLSRATNYVIFHGLRNTYTHTRCGISVTLYYVIIYLK